MARLSDRNNNITFVPSPQSPDVAGFVKETSDDVVPDGWLECNGQSVSTAAYPELFAKIGYTYGGSGGSFNLPGGSLLNNPTVNGDLTVDTDTLFVDASEDSVGIGITNPGSYNTGANSLVVGKTSSGAGITIRSGSSNTGRIYFADGASAGDNSRGSIQYNHSTDKLSLQTGTIDRLVVDTSGNVGVGTVNPSNPLEVVGDAYIAGNLTVNVNRASTFGVCRIQNNNTGASNPAGTFVVGSTDTSTNNVLITFRIGGNTGSGQINANGTSACAFGTFSDIRLKENISDLPSQWESFKTLRPVSFSYKTSPNDSEIGFIAQEMELVYPDAVGTSIMEDGGEPYKTVTAWSKTEARIVAVLKEAINKIEALQSEIDELKGQ